MFLKDATVTEIWLGVTAPLPHIPQHCLNMIRGGIVVTYE